ncbi:hypothetical protein KC362_g54 [Hortaea werneckii]|nr:hypothetical protein KC362_g54 [Hortaea werneckii]
MRAKEDHVNSARVHRRRPRLHLQLTGKNNAEVGSRDAMRFNRFIIDHRPPNGVTIIIVERTQRFLNERRRRINIQYNDDCGPSYRRSSHVIIDHLDPSAEDQKD